MLFSEITLSVVTSSRADVARTVANDRMQRNLPFTRRRNLGVMCPKAKPYALDLMRKTLT